MAGLDVRIHKPWGEMISSMKNFAFSVILLSTSLLTPSFVGCSNSPTADLSVERAQMKVLGILYGKFISGSRGAAPKSEEQFIEYLSSTKPSWENLVDSPEKLLESPRDGKPLVMLYGNAYKKQPPSAAPWLAHEQEGVEGKKWAVNIRGMVEEMDSEQIKLLFPEQ